MIESRMLEIPRWKGKGPGRPFYVCKPPADPVYLLTTSVSTRCVDWSLPLSAGTVTRVSSLPLKWSAYVPESHAVQVGGTPAVLGRDMDRDKQAAGHRAQ